MEVMIMKMKRHDMFIEPDSEAEKYFMNELKPLCKDRVLIYLGGIWGTPYNRYSITDSDFNLIRDYIIQKEA